MTGNFDLLLTAWQDFQIALMVLDTLRMFDDLYSSPISFMLTAVFVLRMQHNMCYVFHSCGTSHCIAWFSFLMTPSSSFCLLPKEVLWPFRFPWYRTQVTKATEKKKKHYALTPPLRPSGLWMAWREIRSASGIRWLLTCHSPFCICSTTFGRFRLS